LFNNCSVLCDGLTALDFGDPSVALVSEVLVVLGNDFDSLACSLLIFVIVETVNFWPSPGMVEIGLFLNQLLELFLGLVVFILRTAVRNLIKLDVEVVEVIITTHGELLVWVSLDGKLVPTIVNEGGINPVWLESTNSVTLVDSPDTSLLSSESSLLAALLEFSQVVLDVADLHLGSIDVVGLALALAVGGVVPLDTGLSVNEASVDFLANVHSAVVVLGVALLNADLVAEDEELFSVASFVILVVVNLIDALNLVVPLWVLLDALAGGLQILILWAFEELFSSFFWLFGGVSVLAILEVWVLQNILLNTLVDFLIEEILLASIPDETVLRERTSSILVIRLIDRIVLAAEATSLVEVLDAVVLA
jgi:hypothetical protein